MTLYAKPPNLNPSTLCNGDLGLNHIPVNISVLVALWLGFLVD